MLPLPLSPPPGLSHGRSHKCYNLVKRPYFELMEILMTLVLGAVLLVWGMGFRRVLVRSSVTAKHLFKGRNSIAQAVAMR